MDLAVKPIKVSSPAKVPAARHKIRRLATPIVGAVAADSVELMASEAISNAILYGCGGATVTVSVTEKALRVEVRDDGPGFTIAGRVDHGRGMTIIAALADRWEFVTSEAGSSLWFEVDREVGR